MKPERNRGYTCNCSETNRLCPMKSVKSKTFISITLLYIEHKDTGEYIKILQSELALEDFYENEIRIQRSSGYVGRE